MRHRMDILSSIHEQNQSQYLLSDKFASFRVCQVSDSRSELFDHRNYSFVGAELSSTEVQTSDLGDGQY